MNMAIDEVLLQHAKVPLLRVYQWAGHSVSFGYFGKVAEVETSWPGRELVRRWTGGGVVPHGEDFTYTLIVPRDVPFARETPLTSYAVIHEYIARLLAETLRERPQLAKAASQKISNACFENPAQHDVLIGSEKVAGAAQRRTLNGLLHQGSIQVKHLPEEFGERLARALAESVTSRELAESEVDLAGEIAARKYGSEAWLRRF
ncbi:lipoate--protein ligase family protein [Verrucomicrobiota bacterium sgz303538]